MSPLAYEMIKCAWPIARVNGTSLGALSWMCTTRETGCGCRLIQVSHFQSKRSPCDRAIRSYEWTKHLGELEEKEASSDGEHSQRTKIHNVGFEGGRSF